jgi:hypothetical protein
MGDVDLLINARMYEHDALMLSAVYFSVFQTDRKRSHFWRESPFS